LLVITVISDEWDSAPRAPSDVKRFDDTKMMAGVRPRGEEVAWGGACKGKSLERMR
jgi:hypothetical protein